MKSWLSDSRPGWQYLSGAAYSDLILSGYCQIFVGEIEESCLLVCHFYLPEKKTSIYVYLVLPEAGLMPEAVLAPGTCSAEPLRTGEYDQYV